MTAALQLLTDAAVTAGVFDANESLSNDQAQYILRRFNRMIGSWANERLMIYETYIDQLPLTSNQASYSTALLAHGNPTQWDNAYVRLSGVDHPLDLIDQQSYNAIGYKPSPGIPTVLYVNTNWPDSTMFFFPTPIGGLIAFLAGRQPLTDALALTTDVSLPPGYEAAIVDNLAVDISPSFGMQPTPQLMQAAQNAKAVLKRANHVALEMITGAPTSTGKFNIYSGMNGR